MTHSEIGDRVFLRFVLLVLLLLGSYLTGGAERALANVPLFSAFFLYLMIPVFRELRAAGELRRFMASCTKTAAWGVPILCVLFWGYVSLVHLHNTLRGHAGTAIAEPSRELSTTPAADERRRSDQVAP